MNQLIFICLLMGVLVACSGPTGVKGDTGSTGASGTNGMTILTNTTCSKTQSGLTFYYIIVGFSTGDKWMKCAVIGNSVQIENAVFYKSIQAGAASEGCIVVSDADSTPSSGYWNFSKNTGIRTAVYTDTGSAANGTTITYTSSDCSTY